MIKLDELVRRLERKAYQPGNASHFIYDPAIDSFLEKLPLFLTGGLQFYHVTCSPMASPDAKGTIGPIGVKDPANGTMLRIELDYEAWIAPEHALEVVRAVAGENPGKRLEELVVEAVQQFARTTAATFFSRLPGRAVDVARELELRISEEYGLSLELKLRLLGDPTFSEHPLPRLDIDVPVHLEDYATELNMQLGVVLSVSAHDQFRATDAMKRQPHLKETLRAVTREFFVDVKLQRFRAELTGSLQQELCERLKQSLSQWYLNLKTLSITLRTPLPDVARFAHEESAFTIELRGYPRPVSLRTRVQLALTDEGRYHRAGAPTLKQWVEDSARRIVQQSLFHVRYSQLHADLTDWERLILKELQEAADAIGYAVKAQITTPELPEHRFKQPFPLVVSGQFATSVDHVKTGLELVLRLQLDQLESVKTELNRGADLEKLFHDVVLDETTAYLHTVSPGFLFTRFSPPVDHTGKQVLVPQEDKDKRRPVTDELYDLIKNVLESRYGLKLLTLTVKQGKSTIRDSYLALTQAIAIPFQVNVPLLGHPGWTMHHGTLQVHGVADEGWPRFQSFQPTLETVTTFVTSAARDLFSEFLTGNGAIGLTEEQARELIFVSLRKRMRDRIGLDTAIVAWYRDPTTREQALFDAQQEALQQQLDDNRRLLGEQSEWQRARIAELRQQESTLILRGKHADAEKIRRKVDELCSSFGTSFGMSTTDLSLPQQKPNKKLTADTPPSTDTPPLPAATDPDRNSKS
ncbi:hypothetical protein [Hyalangium gracile]|uniref:hypothetical protein n=1 Tax=Hyalangium gracile TaxID=394092 RepID=UPI001CCEDC31|nr:hypothetical protein [Hyalangium gracile]